MKDLRKTSHLACRIISGQAFVINTHTSILHELDEVGTFIWDLLDRNISIDKIAEKIVETYDVSIEQAKADIETFLKELESNGLVCMENAK